MPGSCYTQRHQKWGFGTAILISMVRLIVWIAVGLLALSFFGISLEALYTSPTNQENMSFLTKLFMQGWNVIADQLNWLVDWVKMLFHGNA